MDEFFDPLGRLLKVFSRGEAPYVTFELKPISARGRGGGAAEGGAVPDHQRPVVLGEHLSRRAGRWIPRTSRRWSCCCWRSPTSSTEAPAEGVRRAREVLPRLNDEYKRAYYGGIICERCAKAHLRPGTLGSGEKAYHWLREAMSWYEKAEARRPARERRIDPALEYLCPAAGPEPAPAAERGGAGGAEPGVGARESRVVTLSGAKGTMSAWSPSLRSG